MFPNTYDITTKNIYGSNNFYNKRDKNIEKSVISMFSKRSRSNIAETLHTSHKGEFKAEYDDLSKMKSFCDYQIFDKTVDSDGGIS